MSCIYCTKKNIWFAKDEGEILNEPYQISKIYRNEFGKYILKTMGKKSHRL